MCCSVLKVNKTSITHCDYFLNQEFLLQVSRHFITIHIQRNYKVLDTLTDICHV